MTMLEKHLNALLIVILSLILWGALAIQFFENEVPCPLCLLQRLGMMGVAAGALMNLRFGIKNLHYGFSLIWATFGGIVAIRQIALHVCPGFPIFGKPFYGLSLYTWSFITFASVVVYIAFLLIIFNRKEENIKEKTPLHIWHGLAFGMIFLATLINIISSALQSEP